MTKERRNPSREVGTIGRTMDVAIKRGMKPERRKNKMARKTWSVEQTAVLIKALVASQDTGMDWEDFVETLGDLNSTHTSLQIKSKSNALRLDFKKHSGKDIVLPKSRRMSKVHGLTKDDFLALWKS